MRRFAIKFVTVALVLGVNAFADGVIIPDIPLEETFQFNFRQDFYYGAPIYFRMPYHRVKVNITNNVAQVSVMEAFYNKHDFPVEGDYIFPLPSDAAISNFAIVTDIMEIEGQVMDREEARELFTEYLRRGVDPALLEYFGNNLFRAKIFPIGSGEKVDFKIDYEHVMPVTGGLFKFEYPLKIDALIDGKIDSIEISITIKSDRAITTVFSPTHKISTTWLNNRKVEVRFSDRGYLPESDFVLYYGVSDRPFDMSLVTYKEHDDGYFMLNIFPGKPPSSKPVPKDIIFVLDVSGSMSGEKLKQAKEGLFFMLDHLNEGDRFDIIAFNDELKEFSSDGLVNANAFNIKKARKFAKSFYALGATDINLALTTALKKLSSHGGGIRAKYILFLTDGRPTAGVVEVGAITRNIRAKLGKARIFVFGVGYDVNTMLLDKIAEMSNGYVEYLEQGKDIERAITALYQAIQAPALIDVRLTIDGVETYQVYPRKMPDLYYGTQTIVTGRYKDGGEATIRIVGKDANGQGRTYTKSVWFPRSATNTDTEVWLPKSAKNTDTVVFSWLPESDTGIYTDLLFWPSESDTNTDTELSSWVTESDTNTDMKFVSRLWARRRIADLLAYIDEHGEDEEVVDEIKRLGKKYGIVTPYTSFFIREQDDPFYFSYTAPTFSNGSGSKSRIRSQFSLGATLMHLLSSGAEQNSNAVQSFRRSQIKAKYRYNQQVAQPEFSYAERRIKTAGDKTFFYDSDTGFWVDTEYDEDKCTNTRVVTYGSDEFIDLVNSSKKLAVYLSIGKNVIVVVDGVCYKIKG